MRKGYQTIFWGILITTFHINLGPFPILPAFIGYMIVSHGINLLIKEFASEAFKKSSIIAQLMAILSFFGLFLTWGQIDNTILSYLPVVFAIMELYYINYAITGSAEFFLSSGEETKAAEVRERLTLYMVCYILYAILLCFGITFANETLLFVIAAVGVLLRVWMMTMISRLKNMQDTDTPSDVGNTIDTSI